MTQSTPKRQAGAVLFVALIMLLLITLLAIASLRDVALESRITANRLEEMRLTNAAEAGLRAGEGSITGATDTPDITPTCSNDVCMPYGSPTASGGYLTPRFAGNDPTASYTRPDNTRFDRAIRWYTLPVGSTCAEDNCALTGKGGTFFYEVDSCAGDCADANGGQRIRLRSTVAKVFN
ncbi:hypothetical protein D3C78_807610 [compost metagenome]